MVPTLLSPRDAQRLEAILRSRIGWQLADVSVTITDVEVILEGVAHCAHARSLALEEAARLTGRPVINRIAIH